MSDVLRLVADDLTGALDAAAPFVRTGAPVAVFRDVGAARAHRQAWALDATTRGGSAAMAFETARQVAPALATGLAFRKIDSLLRGHVAVEIAATVRVGDFRSVLIAPAFPAQGRVTRRGRQFARNADGTWNAIGLDLPAALAAQGLQTRVATSAADIAAPGIYLCDAETDGDLRAIVAAGRRLAGPVLWCGTSGLARALAGGAAAPCAAPSDPILGVIGSRHEVATAEVEKLRQPHPQAVFLLKSVESIDDVVSQAARRLRSGQSALLALSLPNLPATQGMAVLRSLAAAAAALSPGAVFVSGGDTLAALIAASGAERLDVEGEIVPGAPLSRIAGGRWHGVAVVSKSGAFAAGDVLARLFEPRAEKRRAQA